MVYPGPQFTTAEIVGLVYQAIPPVKVDLTTKVLVPGLIVSCSVNEVQICDAQLSIVVEGVIPSVL